MKIITPGLAAIVLAGISAPIHAQESQADDARAEIALSDDTLQLRYVDRAGRLDDVGRGSRAAGTFFLSEERDIVLSGDLLFPAQLGYDALELYLGPRAYAALLEDENEDVLTLSLGATVRWELDGGSGLAIYGEAFYGPDILTFGAANNLTDLSARVEIRLQPRLLAFAGMRWFEFELVEDEGKRTLQEELFAGVGWRF
jgi:YfaZ precursor